MTHVTQSDVSFDIPVRLQVAVVLTQTEPVQQSFTVTQELLQANHPADWSSQRRCRTRETQTTTN
jgi:hypothetical protein